MKGREAASPKSPAPSPQRAGRNVFRLPSPYDASSSDEEEEEEEEEEEYEHNGRRAEQSPRTVPSGAAFVAMPARETQEERGRGSPYRRDDADTLLRELEKRRREEVKLAVKANVQSYEEDVRRLTESFDAALSTLTQDLGQQTDPMADFIRAESEKRARAVKQQMERYLREEEERTREDNRRLAEFARRKQALDAAKQQKAEEEKRRVEQERAERERAEAEAKRIEREKAQAQAQAEAEAKQREEQAQAQQKEAESKAAADRQARQASAAAATATATAAAAKTSGSDSAVYKQSLDLLNDIKNKTESGIDPAVRRHVMQKAHLNIQQISADREQVFSKIKLLSELIQQSASQNEATKLFCLDLIAQKIVQQGDSQVHVAQLAAFPIADVAVALCTLVPDLTRILIARFHEKCCFTIPYYVPKLQGMSDEDHLVALGYQRKRNTPTGFETEEAFFERMAGFVTLYAAIMQADPFQGKPHPHGIEHAWGWMARTLNTTPRRITATLVYKFLQVAGHALVRQYGRQFLKMLLLLKTHTLPAMASSARAHTPSVTRLQLFIQEAETTNMRNLTTPEGRNY
ncbi:GLE1 family protein [Acanthamoeba castellanii str. Neff]|uniref:mRNA export factor GLE1 n=1 Tax=Acanthamoeba castellanii (strain ATCC 30010 / Neff) TaxID=1257118 RepID=L8GZS1_ACACF|nr:GLE1 family protein [Acanthamoeba castellanii str. Neff]ELR18754.1 GLE1 family protein [Acanthamoeba castellanii str. Neff]